MEIITRLLFLVIIFRVSLLAEAHDNSTNTKEGKIIDNQYLLTNPNPDREGGKHLKGRRNGSVNDRSNSVGRELYTR